MHHNQTMLTTTCNVYQLPNQMSSRASNFLYHTHFNYFFTNLYNLCLKIGKFTLFGTILMKSAPFIKWSTITKSCWLLTIPKNLMTLILYTFYFSHFWEIYVENQEICTISGNFDKIHPLCKIVYSNQSMLIPRL